MQKTSAIAICISGQVRTGREKLEEIAKEIRKIDADVFISVWRKVGGKAFDVGHTEINLHRNLGPKIALFIPKNWSDHFGKVFPDLSSHLPQNKELTTAELLEIFPNAEVEIEDDRPDLDMPKEKNSLRMLYKIWRSNEMKRAAEHKRGAPYKKVIRSRPDMLLNYEALAKVECAADELHVKIRQGHSLHDSFWFGRSETTDKMADFYAVAQNADQDSWSGIHQELTAYAKKAGLCVVNSREILQDFGDFGAYSEDDRKNVARALAEIVDNVPKTVAVAGNARFRKTAADMLKSACASYIGTAPVAFGKGLVTKTAGILTEPVAPEHWAILPVASLALAQNPKFPKPDRVALVLNMLLSDIISWPRMTGMQLSGLPRLVPDLGADLYAGLLALDRSPKHTTGNAVLKPMFELWARRFSMCPDEATSTAKTALNRAITNNKEMQAFVSHALKAEGRLEELLGFAKLYKSFFPERHNADVLVAHAENQIKNAG